jgi:hypothetical protein
MIGNFGRTKIEIDHISIGAVNITSGGCYGAGSGAMPPVGIFPSACDVYLKGVNDTTVTGASFLLKDFNTNGSSSTLSKGGVYLLDSDNKFRFFIDKHDSAEMVDSFYQLVKAAIINVDSDVATGNFWLRGNLTIHYTKSGQDLPYVRHVADVTIALFREAFMDYWNFGGATMEVVKSYPSLGGDMSFNEIREPGIDLHFKFQNDTLGSNHNTIEFWAA